MEKLEGDYEKFYKELETDKDGKFVSPPKFGGAGLAAGKAFCEWEEVEKC